MKSLARFIVGCAWLVIVTTAVPRYARAELGLPGDLVMWFVDMAEPDMAGADMASGDLASGDMAPPPSQDLARVTPLDMVVVKTQDLTQAVDLQQSADLAPLQPAPMPAGCSITRADRRDGGANPVFALLAGLTAMGFVLCRGRDRA